MARIDQGNALTAPIQQPGGKLSNDGYGLLTATVVWKANTNNSLSVGNRGSTCPLNNNLTAHKFSVTYDNLGIATITVDYVGIDPLGGETPATETTPEVSASNGLTSENVSTNPNFFTAGGDGYGAVIAGTSYSSSTLGPTVTYMDGTAKKPRNSFVGAHGACFETESGGRFIGFVDPSFRHFYGKTNYLAPQTSFSGHFYTSEQSTVRQMLLWLGTTSYDNDWAGTLPKIVPEYAGISWHASTANGSYDQLLLAQVNVQDFGDIYKVNYEVRYNVQGWPDEVYRKSSIM
jgi:hypothetical protein